MIQVCYQLDPTRLDCSKEPQTGPDRIKLDYTGLAKDNTCLIEHSEVDDNWQQLRPDSTGLTLCYLVRSGAWKRSSDT